MQLLKIRDFSAFFSDTFQFIKENARHFFINYFTINGIFLILTLLKHYFSSPLNVTSWMFEWGFLLFSLLFGVINWSFVTIYMILYNEKGTNFNHKDIIAYYKANISKIVIYILVSILIAIPVIIVFYIVLLITMITIVGPFLIYAALFTWYSLAFYEYLYSDRPVFDCFGYAFTLIKKKFWAITSSTALLYLIISIIYGFALGALGVFSVFTNMNSTNFLEKYMEFARVFSTSKVMIMMTFLSILYVLMQVVQGIVYFSQKELVEHISANKSIDEIGNIGND